MSDLTVGKIEQLTGKNTAMPEKWVTLPTTRDGEVRVLSPAHVNYLETENARLKEAIRNVLIAEDMAEEPERRNAWIALAEAVSIPPITEREERRCPMTPERTVCAWKEKYDIDYWVYYETSCGHTTSIRVLGWKVCPYCGLPIQIKESTTLE